jgi:predicted amidophosphoribosyltransferase
MTFHNNISKAREADKCPNCKEPKKNGQPFCQRCLDQLPTDLLYDFNQPHEFTQAAAFADACIFLMNDWR